MPQLPLAAPAQHGSGNADQSARHKCKSLASKHDHFHSSRKTIEIII